MTQSVSGESSDLSAHSVTVTADDLPLHCPGSKAPLWSMHPRVFLDVVKTGTAKCAYCGTVYALALGTDLTDHGH